MWPRRLLRTITLALSLSIGTASPAAEPLPPDLEVLKQTIETGSREQALAIARDVIAQEPPDERRIREAMYALDRRGSGTPEDLMIFRRAAERFGTSRTAGSTWDVATSNWAATFRRLHGESTLRSAIRELREPGISEIDATLRLLAIGNELAREKEGLDRKLGLEAYRRYLQSDSSLLQEAALRVTHKAWDHESLFQVKELAFEGTSVQVRSRAYALWMRLAAYGPDWGVTRHSLRDEMAALRDPHDAREIEEWNSSYVKFQTGIRNLAAPEDGRAVVMPPPPSVDLRSTTDTTAPPGGTRPTESRPATDPAPLSATAPPLPASSTNERRPVRAVDPAHEAPNRPHP